MGDCFFTRPRIAGNSSRIFVTAGADGRKQEIRASDARAIGSVCGGRAVRRRQLWTFRSCRSPGEVDRRTIAVPCYRAGGKSTIVLKARPQPISNIAQADPHACGLGIVACNRHVVFDGNLDPAPLLARPQRYFHRLITKEPPIDFCGLSQA